MGWTNAIIRGHEKGARRRLDLSSQCVRLLEIHAETYSECAWPIGCNPRVVTETVDKHLSSLVGEVFHKQFRGPAIRIRGTVMKNGANIVTVKLSNGDLIKRHKRKHDVVEVDSPITE